MDEIRDRAMCGSGHALTVRMDAFGWGRIVCPEDCGSEPTWAEVEECLDPEYVVTVDDDGTMWIVERESTRARWAR